MEAAITLAEIKDNRLYEEKGYDNFAVYCEEEWGFRKTWANDQIRASRAVQEMGTTAIAATPRSLEQA